ncbi:hypothetical protein [Streptomyces kanamyceticus]|uniref:hypothetical protein n=1 Tax=Streptomyces kanamyceticus TaxID=1967 RepID=UPI0037DDA793
MLYAFAFERAGVVVSDLYFLNPHPLDGQETPERGVRLELRGFESGELPGSIYSARPITIGRPLWRVDLLQDANGAPNTFDRTHHHPNVVGCEPGSRTFVEELSDDPLPWLADEFTNITDLLKEAGIAPDEISAADAAHAGQLALVQVASVFDPAGTNIRVTGSPCSTGGHRAVWSAGVS